MRILTLMITLAVASIAFAQGNTPVVKGIGTAKLDSALVAAMQANPLSTSLRLGYESTKKMLLAAAAMMPAENYAFKPTAEVRSFGQILGHVADASWMFCATAMEEQPPKKESAEKTPNKTAIEAALKDALAYCDKAYADSTDATLGSIRVPLFGQTLPKLTALEVNVAHYNQHYGNLVTYLRLNELTPPSSMQEE
jgi:uncharacterized damage-inducible protein DinB